MSEEIRRPFVAPVADSHARLLETAGLGRACLATLIALVAQFGLGMWLNLYVPVPSSDQHAGIVQEITNGPLALSIHALLGTFLIVAAIVLLIRAVRTRHPVAAALTATGLGAILGAFAAGELFVRNGKSSASLWMAVLTGIALLCYISVQALVSTARMPIAHTRAGSAVARAAPLLSSPAGCGRRGSAAATLAAHRGFRIAPAPASPAYLRAPHSGPTGALPNRRARLAAHAGLPSAIRVPGCPGRYVRSAALLSPGRPRSRSPGRPRSQAKARPAVPGKAESYTSTGSADG